MIDILNVTHIVEIAFTTFVDNAMMFGYSHIMQTFPCLRLWRQFQIDK